MMNVSLLKKLRNKYQPIYSKTTWEIINNLIGKRAFTNRNILNLKVGNDMLTDDKQIAENLNQFFVNIG